MDKSLFDETGTLMRFIWRRDRVRIPLWLLSFVFVTILTAIAFTDLYQNAGERQAIAETMKNPAMTAMVGRGYGLDNYTAGALMAHQMLLMTAVVVGLMSILLVARHTRSDEEDGRIELIRSLPVGRLSNLQSVLLVMLAVNVLLAVTTGLGLYILGIESMDLEGSLLYGAALGATGLIFTAITAVFAQLSQNSRSTIGLSIAALIIAYAVRAIGDIGNEALSWTSPLGWILRSEVYVQNIWWPIWLTVAAAFLLSLLSLYLNSIRDLGSGFLPGRTGNSHASPILQSPLGLATRLQRTSIVAWAFGLFLISASYGSVLGDLETFFADVEIMQEFLAAAPGNSLTEQFIPMLMSVMAIIGTIPVLLAILRLKGEEKSGRLEHFISRAVSRNRLMGSYVLISLITSFIMLSLAGLGLGLVGNAMKEEELSVGMVYKAALAYLPAVWIMLGATAGLLGWVPRLSGLVWLYLVFSFVIVYLGALFQFPAWLEKTTPFGHVPQLPIEQLNFTALAILLAIALLLLIAGFIGFNRRDIGN
ncbi:ABC transporter permease [Planococcus sp. 1R117A]|uniref:ABC transporter permease n=1 Tax=Planococcus sp. 1R117A TaxID=3447020 RepID=UPI003EDC9782